jgi:nucleoside-diphosphate-sugar epimerase
MNVLVTGANGYIGSNLIGKIDRNIPQVNIIPHSRKICDLTNQRGLEDFSQSIPKPEIIIHTAAKANSVEYQNSNEVLYSNIIGTQNLIQTFPDSYHIFFSSIVVYKTAGGFHKSNSNTGPKSVYGASKVACENLYNAAKAISGTKSVWLRTCAVVGGQNYTHGLINAIINKIQENPYEIELFGKKPGSVKPYIHIDDIFFRIKELIDNYVNGYIAINESILSTKKPLSVLEVANIIFEKYGVNPKINWRPDKVWKGDNKTIRYSGYCDTNHYKTSEKALRNIDKEIY